MATALVLLEGSAPEGAGDVVVRDAEAVVAWPVADGRWRAVARLAPGANEVVVEAEGEGVAVGVARDLPEPGPAYTPVVLAAGDESARHPDPDGGRGDDLPERLAVALEVLQAVQPRLLVDAGRARRTFALDLDAGARPAVVVHALDEPGDVLRAADPLTYWPRVRASLHAAGLGEPAGRKVVAVMGWSSYDPATRTVRGHCARGGADLALFGGASASTWPRSVPEVPLRFTDAERVRGYDDTAHRGTVWASAATTIGALLHEVGHTLGLGHCKQPGCVMLRGGDRLARLLVAVEPPSRKEPAWRATARLDPPRWCAACAGALGGHPWLVPA